jgi:hypothetical protein
MSRLSISSPLPSTVLIAIAAAAAWGSASTEETKTPTPAETAAHQQAGDVWYKGEWQTIPRLLEICAGAREAQKEHGRAADTAQARAEEIARALAQRTSAYRAEVRPLEEEKARAEAVQRKAKRVLSMPPPREPGMMKVMRGADGDVRRRVEEANRERRRAYEQAIEQYKELREKAAEAYKEAQATIDECSQGLAERRTPYEADRKRLLTERTKVTADLRRARGRVGALQAEVMTVAAALREVPRAVRLRFGAVEWKDEFYTLDALRSMHGWMEATIEAERKDLEAKLAAEGRTLPETWRHPDRAEADALKARIRGAEVDREKAERAVK